MTVTAVRKDPQALSLTLDAKFDASPERVWQRRFRVTIAEIEGGRTRLSIVSTFLSTEAMEQLLAFGMEEGLTQAVGQIDAILAEDAVAARTSAPRT
jgi:uncharacterized protein YndB with AHSA1/START domain